MAFILYALFFSAALAHTWPECFTWQFNDAAGYKDRARRGWYDRNGNCTGYPRGFNSNFANQIAGNRGFAVRSIPCDGSQAWGVTQQTAYPPPKAKVGEIICINWPAKNHYADTGRGRTVVRRGQVVFAAAVDIAIHSVANVAASQADFDANRIATLNYRDCPLEGSPIAGPASGSDQSRGDNPSPGSDLMMCGGCFTVPQRTPGLYDMQWQQTLNNEETYTGCATLEILDGTCTDTTRCGDINGVDTINGPINNGGTGGNTGGTGGYTAYTGDTRTCMARYPDGVFFHEPQMLKVPKSEVTTAEQCASKCQATSGCVKWSFKGDWDLTCFLKQQGVDDVAIVHTGAISGCISNPTLPPATPTGPAGEGKACTTTISCQNGLLCIDDEGLPSNVGICTKPTTTLTGAVGGQTCNQAAGVFCAVGTVCVNSKLEFATAGVCLSEAALAQQRNSGTTVVLSVWAGLLTVLHIML